MRPTVAHTGGYLFIFSATRPEAEHKTTTVRLRTPATVTPQLRMLRSEDAGDLHSPSREPCSVSVLCSDGR
jgi:hypothetical protein